MRRNICRHTDRNTGSTVHKKIRITARQNNRLFFRIVKIRNKVHSIFVDIRKEFHRYFAEPCLGITHGSRTVTVYGTKITMSIDQWITSRPFLRHINERSINRTVSVRVIFTHCITDNTGTFSVRFIGTVVQFDHRIKNPALYRF